MALLAFFKHRTTPVAMWVNVKVVKAADLCMSTVAGPKRRMQWGAFRNVGCCMGAAAFALFGCTANSGGHSARQHFAVLCKYMGYEYMGCKCMDLLLE